MLPQLESLKLLDSLEHAEETWLEKGNWSKMTWAEASFETFSTGATDETKGTATVFGNYYSGQEFSKNQIVSIKQTASTFKLASKIYGLWLCYNNTAHSGYHLGYEHTEAKVIISKWESGVEKVLATFNGVGLEEKFAFALIGTKLEAYSFSPENSEWVKIGEVTDSVSPFTKGFLGFDDNKTGSGGVGFHRVFFKEFNNLTFESFTRTSSDKSENTDGTATRQVTRGRTTSDTAAETDATTRKTSVSKPSSDLSESVDTAGFSHGKNYFVTDLAKVVDAATKRVILGRTTSDTATIVDTLSSTFSAPPMRVENGWAAGEGKQSLRCVFHVEPTDRFGVETATGSGGMGVQAQKTYSLSAKFNINQLELETALSVAIAWFNEKGEFMSLSEGTQITATGLQSSSVSAEAPLGSFFACAQIVAVNHSAVKQTFDFYVDDVIFTQSLQPIPYFDGDYVGAKWEGQFGHSGSVQISDGGPGENTVVIDSVLLDPLTPNIAFSVYYSTEGTAEKNTTETEWERKLWSRVPKTFIANQRQTYVFPEPITAKFVKIEYSYLQAQSYNPGQNQLPTTYKKFPKWVADFFIAQMQEPQFIANTVGVNYDSLDFAYNYFLDDLKQEPAAPVAAPTSVVSTLTQFFNEELETNKVDVSTLAKINLVMQMFTQPPGAQANANTLLGNKVRKIALSTTNYPVEKSTPTIAENLSVVSTLNRDNIVFEQGLPIMYFFITCRHYYKELTATFEHNRAYFAGVKEVAFIRDNYTTTYDGELYIETGGDDTNTELNDFVVEPEGGWFTY